MPGAAILTRPNGVDRNTRDVVVTITEIACPVIRTLIEPVLSSLTFFASMGALYESGRAPSPLSTSRTRRPFPGSNPPPDDDAAGPPPKKRKLCDPTSPPPGVMDGLSTTPLTSKALREFNRRSTQLERENVARCELPPRRDYGLRARRAIANESEQVDSADRFLQQCSSQCLSRVKKFATHGGPDLRHLRGVRKPSRIEICS